MATSDSIVDLYDESIDLIKRYGTWLANQSEFNMQDEWEKLSPALSYFCNAKERHKAREDVFDEIMDGIDNSDRNLNGADVAEEFRRKCSERYSTLEEGENNKIYKEFEEFMLKEKDSPRTHDDSEIGTVSETVITIDPITKAPLTDPVKNIVCGHVYEKNSILCLISECKTVKCPIPGCTASKRVEKKDLVPDVELKRYLDHKRP